MLDLILADVQGSGVGDDEVVSETDGDFDLNRVPNDHGVPSEPKLHLGLVLIRCVLRSQGPVEVHRQKTLLSVELRQGGSVRSEVVRSTGSDDNAQDEG